MTQEAVKPVAHRSMLVGLVTRLADAPEADAAPHVLTEARDAVSHGLDTYSDIDLYMILLRIGERELNCEISKFLQTLCSLDRFYTRPTPSECTGEPEGNAK